MYKVKNYKVMQSIVRPAHKLSIKWLHNCFFIRYSVTLKQRILYLEHRAHIVGKWLFNGKFSKLVFDTENPNFYIKCMTQWSSMCSPNLKWTRVSIQSRVHMSWWWKLMISYTWYKDTGFSPLLFRTTAAIPSSDNPTGSLFPDLSSICQVSSKSV